MARGAALAAAVAVALLAVAGAGGTATQQTPKRGGTLVYAQPTPEPACLTPFSGHCAPGTSWILLDRVHNLVLERAFDFGPHLERRPRLVSTVEYTRKPPFALTYHIRPEARWSDGVPVTSRDFVFTLRALRKLVDPEVQALHKAIRSIRAIDAKTVRVVLRPRTADWPSLFGNILPFHALRGEDLTKLWTDRIVNPKTGVPIGSGPFLVERWVRGKELVLRRNPNYWGPHPAYLDRLVLRIGVGPDDMLGSFRRGELHVAWGFPADLASEFRRQPGARIDSTPGTAKDYLVIRIGPGGNPALRVKRVRRALAYAVDRVEIVRALFGNVGSRTQPSDSVVYLTRDRHYRPNWNRYRSRPSVARDLLQQAGCRRGADRIYTCAGQRLSLRIVTSAGRPDRLRAVELMQSQLRGVGIAVLPTFMPPPALFDPDSSLNRGEFDLALLGFVLEPGGDAELLHGLLACGGNVAGYCQRLVTRDLDQARRILDPRQQARVLNRADVQLAKDVPAIPLHELRFVAAWRPTVRGFVLSPLPDQLVDAENWWLAEPR